MHYISKYRNSEREKKYAELPPLSPPPSTSSGQAPSPLTPVLPPPSLPSLEKPKTPSYQILTGGLLRDLNYKGEIRKADLDRIQKNYPAYKEAEVKTGVNWKILAAIHFRESSLGRTAKNNPFQFHGSLEKLATGNLLQDAISSGEILQKKSQVMSKKPGLVRTAPLKPDQVDGNNVRKAIFLYNGPIYKTPENSPYVMNGLDEEHRNMKIYLGKESNPRWGMDQRLGVLAYARELGKVFGETK